MKKDSKKEQEEQSRKQKQNEQAAKSYCKTCHKEIYPAFMCGCGGSGPGPSGADGGGSDNLASNDATIVSKVSGTNKGSSRSSVRESQSNGKDWGKVSSPAQTSKEKMLMIISELLARNLLSIEDNKGLCTLSIKCDPALLSKQQNSAVKEFVTELKKELDNFKEKNGLSDKDCIMKSTKDDKGNISSFSINIPNKNLYNKFIDQLQKNNLLPNQVMNRQEDMSNKDGRQKFNPTPLSTTLKPSGGSKN